MTKEEIIDRAVSELESWRSEYNIVEEAIDEWSDILAKERSIAFFKWYALRMASFMDYFIKSTDPASRNEQIEQSVKEHEGATIEELYAQFIDNK